MNQLAVLLLAKAGYAEAEPLMRRALAIDEASYGPDHSEVARTLSNLAQLLQATNRLEEAEPLMRQTFVIFLKFTRSTGHLHPHLKVTVQNCDYLFEAMGLGAAEIGRRYQELGREAGFDEAAFGKLLSQLRQ